MNRIKKAREAAGLSQKFVAMTLGVAGPSVSNWESGKTSPTPQNLQSLADLYGVSVDYLLGRDVPPSEQIKNDLPGPGEIDGAIAALSADLTPEELQLVLAYAEGIKAARKA